MQCEFADTYAERITAMNKRGSKLLSALAAKGIDAVMISSQINRRYYTGFTGSNGIAILSMNGRILLTDFRYTIQAKEQCAASGFEVRQIDHAIGYADVEAVLRELDAKCVAFEDEALSVAQFSGYKDMPFEMVPDSADINEGRLIKDAFEISKMQAAQSIADTAFEQLLQVVQIGMTEKEVRNELDYYMRRLGADENSFDTIVGSGPNGALCHAYPGERKLQTGDLVVVDFGAKIDGYCSDMTRTFAVGEPCEELRKIYDIVLRAQLECLNRLKPNMEAAELDKIARDIIADAGYGDRFGHSLGHGFGLEVHEKPYASMRSSDILLPGTTITVEPGIYIEGLGGVRIEDCCVLTDDGYINLCKTPKQLIIL